MADLEKMILAKKEKQFGGFINYMESKYGGKEGDQEEFEVEDIHKKRVQKNGKTDKDASAQKRRKMN